MLGSSKHLNTCRIASVSLMFARNWLPNPSPLLAPFTRPAISTISTVAGTTLCGFTSFSRTSRRSSGTIVEPMLGSMVQKGKFADCAFPELIQLKSVDLPTLGRPTIPHLNAIFLIFLLLGCKNKVNFTPLQGEKNISPILQKNRPYERDTASSGNVLEC